MTPVENAAEVLLARQAILDPRQQVYGYELLYRSAGAEAFDGADAERATGTVLANLLCSLGIENVTGGKPAFINFPEGLIGDGLAAVLPPERAVIELLETVRPTPEVIANCRALKERGYRLALDDYTGAPELEPLTALADILKVDFPLAGQAARRELAGRYRGKLCLLAEKVETQEEFQEARELGYELFQGYFFARPALVRRRDIPANKLRLLRLMAELEKPELEFARVEELIRDEAGLVYKLLRFVNSAAFQLRSPVANIRHAMVLAGERQLRRWAKLVTMAGMGAGKPRELVTGAVVRAHLLEAMACETGFEERAAEFFLLGMLSRMDVLLDCTAEDLIKHIPVSEPVRQALLAPGCGNEHCAALALAEACERGDWERLARLSRRFDAEPTAINRHYLEALRLADALPA